MKVKIQIKTPKGQAKGTEKKLRKYLLSKRTKCKTYTNDLDNEILWEIEGTPREIMKIQRNVTSYELLIKQIFDNNLMKKYGLPRLAPGQATELKQMLTDQTTITIIKEATAQELTENNKPWWEQLKEKFKKQS